MHLSKLAVVLSSAVVLGTAAISLAACGSDGSDTPNGAGGGTGGAATGGAGGAATGGTGGAAAGGAGGAATGGAGGAGLNCPSDALTCDVPAAVAHCDASASLSVCFEYHNDCLLDSGLDAGCAQTGGTYGTGACPTDQALGRCVDPDLVQTSIIIYANPQLTADQAKQSCEQDGGTWCATP